MTPSEAPACVARVHDDIHDLRNLFGVVASGVHALQDMSLPDRASLLAYAIDQAALRGGDITARLLGHEPRKQRRGSSDLNSRIADLVPLLEGLVAPQIALATRLCATPLPANSNTDGLEDILIELVWNARRAIVAGGVVQIRTRRLGARSQVLIADTGRGFAYRRSSALRGLPAQGRGLLRIKRWIDQAHGHLRLRSSVGRGTVVVLDLPLALGITAPFHARRSADRHEAVAA